MALLLILSATVLCITYAPLTDGNGNNASDLNGENLMDLGKKLKLPALQMIGKAIDNMEKEIGVQICALHPCSEWTEWSGCTARFGQFGSKFRTRRCSVNMTSCEIESNSRTEKEFGICIMDKTCPNGYNLTKNGFCMKFVSDKHGPKEAADKQCQTDGGHLLNIDSEVKYKDVTGLLNGFSAAGIWIDGHRKDVNSPWKYTYGSQNGFFKWLSGQPNNNSNELCLIIVFSSGDINWRDSSCTSSYYSICEITKTL